MVTSEVPTMVASTPVRNRAKDKLLEIRVNSRVIAGLK